jgi:hypothetical protein
MIIEKLYSVAEAADSAGCTESYVRRLLRTGVIDGKKIGKWTWILEKSQITKLRKTLGKRASANKSCKK